MDIKKYICKQRIALLMGVILVFFYINQGFAQESVGGPDSNPEITEEEKTSLADKFMATIGQKFNRMSQDDSYLNDDSLLSNYKTSYSDRLNSIADGEQLILLVTTEKVVLSDAIIGFKEQSSLYVSFFEFLSALDFPIQLNMDSQTASGWYISEDKDFYLDISQAFVESDGRKYTITEKDIIDDGTDLLVRYDVLATWFDLNLDPNLEMMAIVVDSQTPLPIETQMLRDKRANEFEYVSRRPILPYKKDPYRLISEPFVDVQLGASYAKRPDREANQRATYSVIGANDLGFMNAKTYIQGTTDESIEDIRLTLNRKADEGETLGPFGLDEVSLGDITPTPLAIVDDIGQERGIRLSSNISDEQVGDTIRLEGDVQPGWDVELYRNDILVDIQQIDSSGRYDFQNVELFFGNNDFRLVFYGPQGQIREEVKSVPIFGNRLAKGEGAYDLSLTQRNKVTYRANELSTVDQGTPALVSRYEYGLTDNVLGFAGVRAWERNKQAELLGVAGLQTNINNFLYSLNTAHETGGGSAVEALAQGLVGDKTIRLRQQFNTDDFDVDPAEIPTVSETEARLQGRWGRKIGYTLQGLHNLRSNDDQRSEVSTNIGTRLGRMNVNKQFSYVHDDGSEDQDRIDGSASLSGVYKGTHWRSRANYTVTPDTQVNSFLVSGLRSINTNLSAELEVENFLLTDLTEGRLSMNYRNDNLIFTPRLSYDSDQELTALLTMNFGLGRDPYTGKSIMTRNRMTNSGAISARAFLDENANGIYDDEEELLEGVSVLAKSDSKRQKTDATGTAFLTGLQEDRLTDITVDRDKFDDPFWITTYEGHSIKPRAGVVQRIDFPIAVGGEIDGVINIIGDNKEDRPARQMTVELMTSTREVIQTQKTAYDGFYLFQDVPPGDYIVNIPENEAEIRGVRPGGNHFIEVSAIGTVQSGVNFTLYSTQLEDSVVAELETKNKDRHDNLMVLRLGSYRSNLLRMLKWVRLKKTHPEIFNSLRPQFTDDGMKTHYLDIGPLYSANRANEICERIKEIEQDCAIRKAVRKSTLDMASAQ